MRTRAKEFQHDSPGIEFGYRYRKLADLRLRRHRSRRSSITAYTPITWPGARAPHAWLKDGRSTLDLFGKGLYVAGSFFNPHRH